MGHTLLSAVLCFCFSLFNFQQLDRKEIICSQRQIRWPLVRLVFTTPVFSFLDKSLLLLKSLVISVFLMMRNN